MSKLKNAGNMLADTFKPLTWTMQFLFNLLSGGSFGILALIMFILRAIIYVIYIIFVKVIPFFIKYIGIPTFILGAIMGVFFIGGHILFVILFIGGLYYYLKNMSNVIYKLPSTTPSS